MSKLRNPVRKDDTRRMEEEARNMEAKLALLRKTMDETCPLPKSAGGDSTSAGGRWKSGAASKPIRSGYVKDVLEAPHKTRRPAPAVVQKVPAAEETLVSAVAAPASTAAEVGTQAQGGFADFVGGVTAASASGGQSPSRAASGATVPSSRASANLQAVMQKQNDSAKEVEAFLADLQLDRYVGLFMEHGFDCMEVVQEMEEEHMKQVGMATGHIIKLRKRLKELNPPPAPAPVPPPAQSSAGNPRRSAGSVTFGGTETREASGVGCGGERLIDGTFNEEEQQASFQEAVRAWREGKAVGEEAHSSKSKPAGSFWSTVGDNEMNLERASTPLLPPPDPPTADSEAQGNLMGAYYEDRIACYNCYKQFYAKYVVERRCPLQGDLVRRLCSEACAERWSASMETKADEYRKRQEKLEKLHELERVMAAEQQAAANANAGGECAGTNLTTAASAVAAS